MSPWSDGPAGGAGPGRKNLVNSSKERTMSREYTMHVISGTHWDREWRHTAEQSKLRLMELVDYAIEVLENNKDYKCFCVDGGTVVLEDYLSVRPENEERIKKLIESKRMQIVRWYTLPETFTVAPEALIRNLLLGAKMAEEFGGAIDSGYTATSYGQTSQLPQIFKGFGINNAIFYRGTNKYELPPFFKWEGKDGSWIYALKTFDEVTRTNWFFYVHYPLVLRKAPKDLTYYYDRENIPVHLCDEGLYERGFAVLRETEEFNREREALEEALETIKAQAMPYAVGRHLLALNMEDNDRPFSLLPQMIEELNAVSPDIEIIQNSLDEYMQTIIEEVKDEELHVHRGELRYAAIEDGFNGLLGATHSSRVKLKLLNEQAETKLLYHAEPLSSIAAFYGAQYPVAMLDRAWSTLLKTHAHDSICGAAVDQAHEDMLYNFSLTNTVAEEVAARSVIALYGKIDSSKEFNDADHTITLFNTLNQPRQEVVSLIIDLPKGNAKLPVGIGIGDAGIGMEYFDIVDEKGNEIECEVLSRDNIKMGIERELDTKSIRFDARRVRILIEAEIPEMGYRTYALRRRGPKLVEHPVPGPDRQLLARENGVLENEYIRVKMNSNGTFSLYNKETGVMMEDLHYFTDGGEVGNAHFSIQPQRNPIRTSLGSAAEITVVETNAFRGTFRIDISMTIPAAATLDGEDRRREIVELPISYWLTLEKGSRFLKIRTRLDNKARDHKLCVNFPTGIRTDYAVCESAFAVEKRCIRWTDTGDNMESFYPFQPMQNFVDVNDGKVGLAVLNKGLREYEVIDDKDRTISITLLRTHRAYMTANTQMIPEEFDKYTGLHSFGVHEYHYALYPHMGDWDEGKVLQAAYQHKVDIKAIQGVPIEGVLPSRASFISISPQDKVMISALKRSEDGSGIIMRMWNTSSDKVAVELKTMLPIESVKRTRLDETIISNESIEDGTIRFEMGAHRIETLLLSR